MKPSNEAVFGHATCTNCGDMLTVTDKATWHSATGCISCDPVDNGDGMFSEPLEFWSGKRAMA